MINDESQLKEPPPADKNNQLDLGALAGFIATFKEEITAYLLQTAL